MKFTKLLLMVIVFGASAKLTFAQNKFTAYLMPAATIKYALTKKINQSFAIEDRNFIYENDESDLRLKHLELAHFTKFEFKENHQLGFGVSYRFESDKNHENELRLMQQYEWKNTAASIIKHRVRTEERIYTSLTKYRLRYQTKLTFPTKTFSDNLSVLNEAMVALCSQTKPEYEERLAVFAEWHFSKSFQLEAGPQYRLSDFTQNASHNLFLSAVLNFEI